jgi:heterodisulfide reductase subunit D
VGGRGTTLGNIISICKSSKTEVAFLADEEWCCGILQYLNGNLEQSKELANHNLEAIDQAGAKRVITTCAGCYRALTSTYPHITGKELPFQVLHISQYLAHLLAEKKLAFMKKVNTTATYHDPCHLGRLSKVYEDPRTVIKHIPGLTFKEMKRIKEQAWCCGAGEETVSLAYPKLAATIGNERIRQAEQTGATSIITTCPHCNTALNRASRRLGVSITCMDLSDLVAKAMGR